MVYIYIYRIVIYVINFYSTRKFATNGDFYAHISQRAWRGHISFRLNIPLNGQPSTCLIGIIHVYFIWIFYLRCIIYSYIHINRRLWSYGFTRYVSFNVPDPGTIWDGTVHALRLHCAPPCLLFILDRQRKLTVIHKCIFPHTPLFHCTVHNQPMLSCWLAHIATGNQ